MKMIQIKLRYIVVLLLIVISFALGIYAKTLLTPAIAVVNLEQVLAQFPKLIAIQEDNERKLSELEQWVKSVNKDLNSEKDKAKRNKLAEQYKKITHEKEIVIRQEYATRLKDIDSEITGIIDKVAKQQGCNAVFVNTSMVSGGKDITRDVIKEF